MKTQFKTIQLEKSNSFWQHLAEQIRHDHRPTEIQKAILAISDSYTQTPKDQSSIWLTDIFQNAYLSYFLPLNVLRNFAVLQECARLDFFKDIEVIYDFGCGPGTFEIALEEFLEQKKDKPNNLETREPQITWEGPKEFFAFDKSREVQKVYEQLKDLRIKSSDTETKKSSGTTVATMADWPTRLLNEFPKSLAPKALTVFSYALTEMDRFPKELFLSDSILILEPSNQSVSRRLQLWRDDFLKMGYHIWAPCTHNGPCPLLAHSKTDWCHQRVHVKIPKELAELHKGLPIQNDTLTYSYLLLKKSVPPHTENKNLGRTIGDTLYERGKVKQAFCRNSDREFLSWLTRHGEPEPIARGSLIELPPSFDLKGGEIRLTENIKIKD